MFEFLFGTQGFTPHGYSLAWDPIVLKLHILADLLMVIAYVVIPALILSVLIKRREPELTSRALALVCFIVACGTSHLMGVVTIYYPLYALEAVVNLGAGLISLAIAVILWRLVPALVALPSHRRLMQIIDAREMEIAKREKAQEELLKSEAALARKVEELETANAELKEFAYAASHDLKSPANTLTLWLDEFELEFGENLGAEGPEMLGEAREIVGRMRILVDDILRYSRIVNTDPDQTEEIDLVSLTNGVISNLGGDLKAAGGTIEVGPMPPMLGHPRLIFVVLQNFIGNAIKFRAPDRPLRIDVSAKIEGGPKPEFVLSVRDNGIGIDPKDHEQIFSMFNRLHSHETYDGTGLGLALCRRVAISHGGRLELDSTLGQGAEFRLVIPMEVAHVLHAA
ncbi:MAG: ATP-binding protein [Pseudomonadota bacterium]